MDMNIKLSSSANRKSKHQNDMLRDTAHMMSAEFLTSLHDRASVRGNRMRVHGRWAQNESAVVRINRNYVDSSRTISSENIFFLINPDWHGRISASNRPHTCSTSQPKLVGWPWCHCVIKIIFVAITSHFFFRQCRRRKIDEHHIDVRHHHSSLCVWAGRNTMVYRFPGNWRNIKPDFSFRNRVIHAASGRVHPFHGIQRKKIPIWKLLSHVRHRSLPPHNLPSNRKFHRFFLLSVASSQFVFSGANCHVINLIHAVIVREIFRRTDIAWMKRWYFIKVQK